MPKKKTTKKKSTRKITKKKTIRRRNPEKETVKKIQELMNEEYDIDLRELAKQVDAEDDDIIVASYWIGTDWHGGQFTPLYKVLSVAGKYYKPGPMISSAEDEGFTAGELYKLIEEEIQAIEKRRAKARKNPHQLAARRKSRYSW